MRSYSILIISLISFISCSSKKSENVPFSKDEYEIFTTVLDSLYNRERRPAIPEGTFNHEIETSAYYVLRDSTFDHLYDYNYNKLLNSHLAPKEMIDNYKAVNSHKYSLNSYLKYCSRIKLINRNKFNNYWHDTYRDTGDPNKDWLNCSVTGWNKFKNDFPKCIYKALISISRVGINKDTTLAVIGTYGDVGQCTFRPDWCFLEKVNNKWVIKKIIKGL